MQYAPELQERLQVFRNCSQAEIFSLVSNVIPEDYLPSQFLQGLSDVDRTICCRAIMISWGASKPTIIPNEAVLRVVLADIHGQDALVEAGWSDGKALAIALCILLDDPADNSVTITISPLRRLQGVSECEFYNSFGIPTVKIDKETPRDDDWWNTHVYDSDLQAMGSARHILVTPEQILRSWPGWRLSKLGTIMQDRGEHDFQSKIIRVNVDEAHSIHTVSIPKYTHPHARSPWGRLFELKAILSTRVRWKAFSTTFPPHVLKTVERAILGMDYISIRKPYNRVNTMYATHQVHGSIEKLRNYECLLKLPFSLGEQPRVLIFVDEHFLACKIADHLEGRLPSQHRRSGIVRHYHTLMSNQYLQQAYHSFASEEGRCRILVAVLGDPVSVEFPNVDIVCMAGLPPTMVDALQSAALLKPFGPSLFVIFYEKWALGIEEDEYADGDQSDPDRVRNVDDLSPGPPKRSDKAPLSAIQLVQSLTCLRCFFADHLGDDSPEAVLYAGPFCCDRHDDGFQLQSWLPGALYSGTKESSALAEPVQAEA